MDLYLAEFKVLYSPYMGKVYDRTYTRLVRAEDYEAAEAKIRDKFGDTGEIGDGRSVVELTISNVIE